MLVQRQKEDFTPEGYFAEQQKILDLELQIWRSYCLIQEYFAEGPKNDVFCLCYNKKTHSIEIWRQNDLENLESGLVSAVYVFVEFMTLQNEDLVIFETINCEKFMKNKLLFYQYRNYS